MKLQNHISPLYLYIYIVESDSLKLLPLFEDLKKTSFIFDVIIIFINSIKKMNQVFSKKPMVNLLKLKLIKPFKSNLLSYFDLISKNLIQLE